DEQVVGQDARLRGRGHGREAAALQRLGERFELALDGAVIEPRVRVARDEERALEEVELVVRLRRVGPEVHASSIANSAPPKAGRAPWPRGWLSRRSLML